MNAAPQWQKSSFSGGGEGNTCVELASFTGEIRLRESDTPAATLSMTPATLALLLQGIRSGTLRETKGAP
ncbi:MULTISPECIES: DUF397 domain-containing protein [unclassified Streptomyces]|uniref:DUF397 domain-containing protein n=1 Tax=unclassified Streptomyces TaxID=2593676 RepID=UPI0037F6FF0C